MGAVLRQRIEKKPTTICYATMTLAKAQMNYTTTEKGLLAVVYALAKFQPYILGNKIIIYTDHAALKYSLSKKGTKPRLIWWVLLHQEFNMKIKYKKGSENFVADHLSHFHITGAGDTSDTFLDEYLLAISSHAPWFTHIVNFLMTRTIPEHSNRHKKRINFYSKKVKLSNIEINIVNLKTKDQFRCKRMINNLIDLRTRLNKNVNKNQHNKKTLIYKKN